MPTTAYAAYAENSVLSVTPMEGITMLYEGAIDDIRKAREHLSSGNRAARAQAISHALEILTELSNSLDHERGGELSASLASLYDYIQRRLIEANFEQREAPLAESQSLLETLLEAWRQISVATAAVVPPANWEALPSEPVRAHYDVAV